MITDIGYNREKAVEYAQRWAYSRNTRYMNFDSMGGDCTNFISQSIHAGCNVMNYTKPTGWYYNSASDRAPAWTGVPYLYNFLTNNYDNKNNPGPYGVETDENSLEPGDLIQLGDNSDRFYHSLLVTNIENSRIYVCTHTFDALNKPLDMYLYMKKRCIHIVDCRKWV